MAAARLAERATGLLAPRRECKKPRRARGRSCCTAAAAALALLAPATSRAQAIRDNHYTLDLFQGPVLAPIRVTGIAGAYAGYAEGIEGMVANAAAPAVREPDSVRWAEGNISGSISLPNPIEPSHNDFDNSGEANYVFSRVLYGTLGGLIQVGAFGAGANAEFSRFSLAGAAGSTYVTLGKHHLLGAVGLLDHQLLVGGGARIVTLGLNAPGAALTLAGAAPELGFLVRPDWESFRVGMTFRFPVDAGTFLGNTETNPRGVEHAGSLVLPEHVIWPWELETGVAVQVGPRPLNPSWINPHDQERALAAEVDETRLAREHARREELLLIQDPAERAARERVLDAQETALRKEEDRRLEKMYDTLREERRARYWNWPRERLLFTAELLVTGNVDRGVGIGTFLSQDQRASVREPSAVGTSGADVNFSPRFGIETEPIPTYLKTRFGGYYEPNRFGAPVGRQHFTFGADLRVVSTTFWGLFPRIYYQLQGSIDVAPRYFSPSFSIGVWH